MNCRELLCISILIFCTTTNAAPSTQSKWLQLSNEPKFQPYKSTLLSPNVMSFLNVCYDPKCCSLNDEYSCSLYFDVVSWAQEMRIIPDVSRELIETISPQPVMDYCAALNNTYTEVSTNFGHKIPFDEKKSNSQIACIIGCGDLTANTRPPCRVSLWLLKSVSDAVKQQNEVKDSKTKEVQESASKSEDAAAENQSPDISPPVQPVKNEEPLKPKALPDTVGKVTTGKEITNQDGTSIQTSPTKPEEPSLKEETNVGKGKPSSNATASKTSTEKKMLTKEPTPSGIEPGNGEDQAAIKPIIDIKTTTTETSSVDNGQNLSPKEKSIIDQGLEDYDDEMNSNENKPNSVDQMEDGINEQDESVAKLENGDNEPVRRIDQDLVIVDGFKEEEPASNFFFYFLFGMFAVIAAYIAYNNKSKIVALVLEGRRAQGGRGRRKHTAAYRKLDSNLEEAIMSAPSGRTTQVIY